MVRIGHYFRLLGVRAELSGLSDALELMEGQIKFLSEQRKTQASADLRVLAEQGHEWEHEDVQLTLQERDHAVEHFYPRVFRGPFLVTLWAIYESGLKEVARFIKLQKDIELDVDEIRGPDVQRRVKRYFEAVLGMSLPSDQARARELSRLYMLRNAFAHANGRLASLKGGVRDGVKGMIKEGLLTESLGYVIPSKAYLAAACGAVHTELSELVDRTLAWHDECHGRR